MEIGETIMRRRQAQGWTQAQLAAALRVSVKTVANWEHSRTLPDIDNVVRLATLWQLPLETLLGGELVAGITRQQKDARWLRWLGLAPTANNTILAVLLFTAIANPHVTAGDVWLLDAAIALNGAAMIGVMVRNWGKKTWRQYDVVDWVDCGLTLSWLAALMVMGLR